MKKARDHADALEAMCSSREWSLPTYHEMCFHGQLAATPAKGDAR
jgi:glutamine synthetase type III